MGPIPLVAVPEPSTWAMMLIGFAGLGFVGYRRAREPRALVLRRSLLAPKRPMGLATYGDHGLTAIAHVKLLRLVARNRLYGGR